MRAVNPQVLHVENARLITLLEQHGIDWRLPNHPELHAPEPEPTRFSTSDKVTLYRRLFRGRVDVYPIRWESKTSSNFLLLSGQLFWVRVNPGLLEFRLARSLGAGQFILTIS